MAYIKPIKTAQDIPENSHNVLQEFKSTIDGLPPKKAEILLYWIDVWKKYIIREENFDYAKLTKYKRGMIIQAHLGFKVGSEQGGLHYAVVVENDNSIKSGTVMAIPIQSLKKGQRPCDVHPDNVYLGTDLFKSEIETLTSKLITLQSKRLPTPKTHKEIKEIERKLENYKKGSIAIINQMCAISKLRIYHPLNRNDELSDIMLSDDKLDEIDDKIISRFTKMTQSKMLTKAT